MKSTDLKSIDKFLRGYGYSCYRFSVETVGEYLPIDAEWNYKDIPHLNHIHGLVDSGITFADEHIATSILMQEIRPFFKVPMTLVNYHISDSQIIYHSQFLFWVLIIETNFDYLNKEEKTGCRVVTNYNIYSPRFFKWFCPLFKFLIKRNNRSLMKDDVPMRERRHHLRKSGYKFAVSKNSYHSYVDTLKLAESNIIEPELGGLIGEFEIPNVPKGEEGLLVGDDVGRGFRVIHSPDMGKLLIFERVCKHFGADLSKAVCKESKLKCPWHGNLVSPIGEIKLTETFSVVEKRENFTIKLENKKVRVFKHLNKMPKKPLN